MGARPLTTTFLTAGLLWALWHWRRTRLIGPAAKGGEIPGGYPTAQAPYDARAALAQVAA